MDINIHEPSRGKKSIPKAAELCGKVSALKAGREGDGEVCPLLSAAATPSLMPFASKVHPVPWTIQTYQLASPSPTKTRFAGDTEQATCSTVLISFLETFKEAYFFQANRLDVLHHLPKLLKT